MVSGMSPVPDLTMGATAMIVLILTAVLYLHLRRTRLYFY